MTVKVVFAMICVKIRIYNIIYNKAFCVTPVSGYITLSGVQTFLLHPVHFNQS